MASNEKQAGQGRRQLILAVVGAIALAVLVFLIWLLVLRTPMVPAFVKLKATDASMIVDELKRQKVPFRLEDNGSTVLVPQDQVDAARIGILGGDLPLKGTVGFELFSKSDMGLTEFAQKINYQRALQGELARTLMAMSTIESARVHITLPETGVFQEDHRPAKASVTITPKLSAVVDGGAVMGIQRLIASAVEGLDAGNVVVLDGGGKQLSAEPAPGIFDMVGSGGESSAEQAYAAKVRSAIAQLLTDPAMRITVIMPAKKPDTSPSASIHPVRVTLALTSAPTVNLRERVTPLLQGAAGFDPVAGDSLEIIQIPATSPYQVGAPVASAVGVPALGPAWEQGDTPALSFGWIAAAVIIAVAAAVLFSPLGQSLRRRDRSTDFSARLRHLLDQDDEVDRA